MLGKAREGFDCQAYMPIERIAQSDRDQACLLIYVAALAGSAGGYNDLPTLLESQLQVR